MISGRIRFNIYLLGLLAVFGASCQSPHEKEDEMMATLALHIEVTPEALDSRMISVFRNKPLQVRVDRMTFLTEADVVGASIVEDRQSWSLQIKFGERGSWVLEQYTTSHPGKHIAIFSTFGLTEEPRWLGAPLISRRISNGTLTFTPDASREEAEQIVLGLNNLATEVAKRSKW